MKKIKQQMNKLYIYLAIVFMPVWAFAETTYEPLVKNGIPGLSSSANLADYVNALFNISIMVGVILSVLIIAYSGFEYMTMDVATNKTNAKTRIGHAVAGLLMLLGTYLVLYQINPDIVNIKF